LEAGYPVSGVVRDEGGRPLAGCGVVALQQGKLHLDETGEDGAFRIEGLAAGAVQLELDAAMLGWRESNPWVQPPGSEPMTVPAGSSGVVLVGNAGKSLTLRVQGWKPEFDGAVARLHRRLADGGVDRYPSWTARIDDSGLATFRNVPDDQVFGVYLGPLPDDTVAVAGNLRPARDPIPITLQPGGVVRGKVTGSAPHSDISVSVIGDSFVLDGTSDEVGNFEIAGVPMGRWRIVATSVEYLPGGREGEEREVRHTGSVEASPGSTVEILLAPSSDR
jgi:hypothetical protein